ncbi:MAG TPA: shikimate dehydrogenase [Mycobacteriales bacterium]|nr:shikimate dehydrogenase [Mycobacteriales bacterium]
MRAAVLGRPVGHSLSPVLHSAAYAALGLADWAYTAVDCGEDELAGTVAGLGPDWAGLSLTMPLKRVALAVADEVDPLAAAVGAANTLVLGGRRVAYNTDVAGIAAALGEAGLSAPGSAVILGAGGTAQAALAALGTLGVREPVVLVRDPDRAGPLRETARRLGLGLGLRAGLPGPIPAADVVVSTLPAGAADDLTPPGTIVLDVIYAPWPTRFAAAATEAGATVVSGLAMLLHQAAAQVELMTGRAAPVEAMRAALTSAVRARTEKPPAPPAP